MREQKAKEPEKLKFFTKTCYLQEGRGKYSLRLRVQ